jgi:phosphoglycolate phosphatase
MSEAAQDAQIPPDHDVRPLVLFDMDGTLTDPADGIISCHRWALAEVGFDMPEDLDTRSMIGPPAEEAYAMIGVPSDLIGEATRLYRERFAIAGWLEDSTYPGIDELVAQLHQAGWMVGVATMKLEPFAERIVDRVGLRPHIDVVAGSDVARTRITKRAVIEHALTQLDRTPSGVAMVGDRRHDIEAARSLQMTSIGVAWGFGSVDELIGADAHAIAVDPSDVAEFLLG